MTNEDLSWELAAGEKQHCDAMLFQAQCLWRDYESLVAGAHTKQAANQLLDKIDEVEATLRDFGYFSCT